MDETRSTSVRGYSFVVEIPAAVTRVWSALVHEIDAWWLPDFRMVSDDSLLSLEARAGGQLLESSSRGSLEWYRVQLSLEEEALTLQGFLAPAFGGPGLSTLELRLERHGAATRLHVSDTLLGPIGEEVLTELEAGWRRLFEAGLAAHCRS